MRIKGQRRCRACGTDWSYFEEGTITCPECGSPISVSRSEDERLQTGRSPSLDLADLATALEDRSFGSIRDELRSRATQYLAARGFVRAGDLQPLDERYVTAWELKLTADSITDRRAEPDRELVDYLHARLLDPDSPPDPGTIPAALTAVRSLAVIRAVGEYRSAIRRILPPEPPGPVLSVLDRIRNHERRIRLLEGAVDPAQAVALRTAVTAVRDPDARAPEGSIEEAERALARIEA